MAKPYYNRNNFKLYHGDSLQILEQFPEDHFDMIFADPPYFLSNGSFTCQNGKMVSVKKGDWDLGNGLKKRYGYPQSQDQKSAKIRWIINHLNL